MLDLHRFYIDGKWVISQSTRRLAVINPATEAQEAEITVGNKGDIDCAVSAAERSFEKWSVSSKEFRIQCLEQLLSEYEKHSEQMADYISKEMGAPIDLAIGSQVQIGRRRIIDAINTLRDYEFISKSDADEDGLGTMLCREPIGVVAMITPWNWPMNQVTLKVCMAIAAGCTMVLKPSEIAPLSSMLFAHIIDKTNLPAGVFNLVNGDGATTGNCLSAHPRIQMVSFTGSTRAGILVSKNAADSIKRVSLELGGKGANIIFADADQSAINRGLSDCFQNSGQSCNAPTRMLIEDSIYEQTVAKIVDLAKQFEVNDPQLPGEHIGPVVSKIQYEKIQQLIEQGINEGAKLEVGGLGKPEHLDKGYYVKPTVFSDVNNQMTIAREEVFGPVLCLLRFKDEQEAVAIANDTEYGLTNYIQTQDKQRALRIARQLRSGMVEINGTSFAPASPFGGYKQSGNGRESGVFGLEEFLEVKAISGVSEAVNAADENAA